MYSEKEIEAKILELRSELKTDRLDMSFGEIMNLYDDGDLIITPEYQRSYRWSGEQKTRFIESVLLGIPIPPIFVAEDDSGKWELVDGLQRISTILSFFGLLKNDYKRKNFFKLSKTELTNNYLEDVDINHLSTKLKLTIKRAVCRIEILKWDSSFDMRYELFNRLNTGASPLTEQEIRNCVFIGKFNTLLSEIASYKNFKYLVSKDEDRILKRFEEKMYFEELILRYFSIIFGDLNVKNGMPKYLDKFMEKVNKKEILFEFELEKEKLLNIIDFLYENFEHNIFYGRNNQFTENIYETVMYLSYKFYDKLLSNPNKFLDVINIIKNDSEYKRLSGQDTGQNKRIKYKLERADVIFNEQF